MNYKSIKLLQIAIVLVLGISLAPLSAEQSVYYRVRPGDTLSGIAQKYRTSVGQLARLNNLNPRGILRSGQRLKVSSGASGGSSSGASQLQPVYHRVRSGETLSHIARRYRTSITNLRRWNNMQPGAILRSGRTIKVGYRREIPTGHEWKQVTEHTRVLVPYSYHLPAPQKKVFEASTFQVSVYAEHFAQGHAVYLEIVPRGANQNVAPTNSLRSNGANSSSVDSRREILQAGSIKLNFMDAEIPVDRRAWGYKAFFALPPDKRPGTYPIQLRITYENLTEEFSYPIEMAETQYITTTRTVYLGHAENFQPMKPEVQQLIEQSTRKKAQAFSLRSPNMLGGDLVHPRDMHKVTSPFFVRRRTIRWYYKDGQKVVNPPHVRYHRGLDLRGFTGAPIFAMANGRVVCAQRMHFEGNYTIIDHGHGVFTGYMHQSRFLVKEGDLVRAGQKIGLSGATGLVTGPHLHQGLWIRGVPVQPLSLLSLPIRD